MTSAEPGVSPEEGGQLKVIALSMGGGLTMMAGLVFWSYLNAAAKLPTPKEAQSTNFLTTVMMIAALLAIIASEILWRGIIRGPKGAFGARVKSAYIVRLGCREGAGLLGMTVAYVAALNGVLRAYPAYWVNLAPYAMFLGFLATHWPSPRKLTSEARELLVSGR